MSAAVNITDRNADAWHQQMCQALRFGHMLETFPNMVARCLEHRLWERRFCRAKGRPFKSALEYFTHNEPDGVGTTPDMVAKLLKGTDVEGKWREAAAGHIGRPSKDEKNDNIINLRAQQGTSRAFTLARLEREAPKLAAAVHAGEMSANAAAIEAGFRKKPTPFEQVQKLIPKLTKGERAKLVAMLGG